MRAPVFESISDKLIRFVYFRKLSACALFALAGCILYSFFGGLWVYAALFGAVFLSACVFFKRKKRFSIFLLLLCVMLLSSFYTSLRDQRPVLSVNKKGDVTGVVSNNPLYQPDKNRTALYLDNVTIDGQSFPYKAYVYMYGNNEENAFEYGQTLSLPEAGLWLPDGQTNPDGFDFKSYLWRKGAAVCASSSVSKAEIVSEKSTLKRSLYRFSAFLSERFEDVFPENAGVMRALLLGDRTHLDDETYESFQDAGVAHLVALSGLHVSCVAVFFETLLLLFMIPAKPRGAITVILIFLYTIMTGASASLMRAAMMYTLFVAARFTGNPSDLLTRLSGAFLIQLLINPLSIHDTGMQLSYLSVLSLALMNKPVRTLFPYIKSKREDGDSIPIALYNRFADAFSASAAIQFGTLPSMAALFHSVPVLSVPVNLLVVPLGLMTVYLGASAIILSFAFMPLALMLGKVTDAVWTAILYLTNHVSDLSFAMMNVRAWKGVVVFLYFALMALASPYMTEKKRVSRALTASLSCLAIAAVLWPAPVHEGLDIVFLDAGYADSCVVLAEKDAYVVDCGKENEITADYLTGSGANVKGIFISHPDIDHAGGVGEILKRYPEAEIYVSECWDKMDVGEVVGNALEGRHIHYLSAGDVVPLSGNIEARIVWPEAGFTPKEDNDGSLVINIVYESASALLTGDVTERVDKHIKADADILKVAHHGSKKATSDAFLDEVTPEIAVISVSSNGHGHPTEEVLSRLSNRQCAVYRTDHSGAITITMLEDGTYRVKTYLSPGG